MPKRPLALLIDDGELDDVARLLAERGVRAARLPAGAEDRGWRQPEHLLVVSGARVLRLSHPVFEAERPAHYTKVAVVERPSRTLCSRIGRMGFDHIVQRPVHPEALRLLIESALHGSREQRARPRFPVGCVIRWRSGLRRRYATLAEISARGCRLLVRAHLKPRRLTVLLPGACADGRELRIAGAVVRYERRSPDLAALTVVFGKLGTVERQRLRGYLSTLEVGPPRLVV